MANVDKYNAVIEYLKQCPQIASNPLFFNFAQAEDNNKQLLMTANEKVLNRQYIDGSVQKRFTFTIIDYRSVIYQALAQGKNNENVEEILDVQGIIDWIEQQDAIQNYPSFGDNCIIDSISSQTDNPNLNGVDTNLKPAIAKYHISIVVDYLDTSKCIWNK